MASSSRKKRVIKYNFSGLKEDVSHVLRLFSTDSVLKCINREATKIFLSDSNPKGVEYVKFPMVNATTKQKESQEAIIQSWSLIDLAYYSILWSNDFRGYSIESDDELFVLAVAVDNYKERNEKELLPALESSHSKFMYYLYGFAGEQFKHQGIGAVFDSLHRELSILLDIGKTIPDRIDIEREFTQITGMRWDTMVAILLILWGAFQHYDTLSDVIHGLQDASADDLQFIESIANRFATSYEEIRRSPLKRQILYSKPFVVTQHGDVVSISPFVNLSLVEHSIQWTIRNYYMECGIRAEKFTSFFGKCFEGYFRQLLDNCLLPGEYQGITEECDKRADWIVQVGSIKMLIEQKSSLLLLAAKQQESDVKSTEKYVTNTMIKAMNQLERTENAFNNGKYIKIVLLYEDYLKAEFIDYVFEAPDCTIENDNYYWMVTISEMERLLSLKRDNQTLFEQVVNEKIKREIEKSKEGKSIDQILREFGCTTNDYLQDDAFQKYKTAVDSEIKRILS